MNRLLNDVLISPMVELNTYLLYPDDQGVVGVASAGPDFYVIALADSTVQQGALAGRLRSLGSHLKEALSQLD